MASQTDRVNLSVVNNGVKIKTVDSTVTSTQYNKAIVIKVNGVEYRMLAATKGSDGDWTLVATCNVCHTNHSNHSNHGNRGF